MPGRPTVLTSLGVVAAVAMVMSYALEARHRRWIAVFAVACAVASFYASATGAWLFAALEFVWAGIALRRFLAAPTTNPPAQRAFLRG